MDPEAHLPPLPASWAPRGANTTSEQVAENNGNGRVIGITSASKLANGALSIGLSFSVWRPAYYSRYWIANDRFGWQGPRGTRPGVTVYYTRILCATPQSAAVGGSFANERERTGEYPTQARVLVLSKPVGRPSSCDLTINTGNPAYPFPVPDLGPLFSYTPVPRDDISLEDPKTKVEWIGELSPETDELADAQTLANDNLDLFTFRAVPGYTYRFCTTEGMSSTECVDESSSDNVAELLIVGSAEEGESGLVAAEDGLTRGANGLQWQVPNPAGATVETYAVVVRRRARFEGGDVPDYGYRLKYTIPQLPPCESAPILLIFCTPGAPLITPSPDVTDDGITVHFTPGAGATSHRAERVGGGEVETEDVAHGDSSHPFEGLAPGTAYRIRIQARNAAGSVWSEPHKATTSFPSCPGSSERSETAGAQGATDTDSATACLPQIPALERIESTTDSITVRWNNVSPAPSPDAVRYELRIDGGTAQDPNSPDGMDTRSHRFGTLTPNTLYEIQIRALLGTVESAWSMSQSVYTMTARPVVPPAPAGLRVTEVTDTSARLHWDGVTGATGYKTRRDGDARTLQTLGDVNEYPFTGLTPRRAHVLEVAASNSHGDSPFASLTLLVPPTLNAPTATANSITLTWTALANLTYEVKLGAGSAESARNPSSHTFSPLPSDTPHTLYVRARNAQGPSAWASANKRTTGTTVVIPPETKVCWDGSVIPVDQDCPPETKVCWDDSVIPVDQDCPPETKMCWNDSVIPVDQDCPPETKMCWNDSVIPVDQDCPPETKMCWNDSVIPVDQDCPPETKICWNGSVIPVVQDCPPETKICWNDSVIPVDQDCPPETKMCWNDSVIPVDQDCPPETKMCWNDSVIPVDQDCPPETKMCWNDSVIPVDQDCPPETKMCWNGSVIPVDQDCPVNKCERDPKPADYTTMPHPPIPTVEYQWITMIDMITFDCTLHQEQRTRTTTTTYHVTFSCSGGCWVSSVRPSSTSTTGAWSRTGVTQSCSGSRSASANAMTLSAGSYEMQWGEQRIVFTVPAGATVELSRRQQESGDYVAVLSMKQGAELVVGADALSGDDQARSTRFASTTDPTLSAIAASLRDPAAEAPEPSATTPTECPVAEPSDDGVTNVDLDAAPCAIVRGGGTVTVAQVGHSLAITLAAERDWSIMNMTGADQAETAAVMFFDFPTGGSITLALTDGSELARNIPEGNTDLPSLFDAMIPAAPADGGS